MQITLHRRAFALRLSEHMTHVGLVKATAQLEKHVKRKLVRPSRMRPIALVVIANLAAAAGLPPTALAQPSAPATAPVAASGLVGPGFYVSDLQRSLKFYRDILGMTVRMQYGPSDRPDAVLGFGNEPTQAGVMLLSDRGAAAPRKIEHGHGYDRLAIRLADLAGTHARLRAAGYTVSDIREVHGVFLMAIATDPDGYKIELLGPKPRT